MIDPVGHRVLVKRLKVEERDERFKSAKAAGIVFTDTALGAREAGVDRGIVIKVGEDAFKAFHLNSYGDLANFKPWCNPGDWIAFAKYSGMVLKNQEDDQEYIVINDADVVALIEEPK